ALTDPDDPDEPGRPRFGAVAGVEAADEVACVLPGRAVAAANAGGKLVDGPEVAERDVVAGRLHAPARLDAGLEPRLAVRRHPGATAREVDLRHRMDVGAERTDARGLARPGLRLVGHGWDR